MALVSQAPEDQTVLLESKVTWATKGLQVSPFLGLKARGANLVTQVLPVSQVNLVTQAKIVKRVRQGPAEMLVTRGLQDPLVFLGIRALQAALYSTKETPAKLAFLGYQVIRE